jgi:hypothetical protein
VLLLLPEVVDELCGECVGCGVVKGSPEEEQEFEQSSNADITRGVSDQSSATSIHDEVRKGDLGKVKALLKREF